MRVFRWMLVVAVFFLSGLFQSSQATTIEFEAEQVPSSPDAWQYTYFVSGRVFSAVQGFTIFFDLHLFTQLQDPPPAVNSDWDAIVLQPDLNLPDNGAYDAFALVNGASLADPFRVGFRFVGAGTPGSQPFTINQFDSTGRFVSVLETGVTVPRSAAIPEPRPIATVLIGLAFLAGLTRKPRERKHLKATISR